VSRPICCSSHSSSFLSLSTQQVASSSRMAAGCEQPPNIAVELTGKKLALFPSQLTASVGPHYVVVDGERDARPAGMEKYRAGVFSTIAQYGGRDLTVGGKCDVIEVIGSQSFP
jgi:hypothetical protein